MQIKIDINERAINKEKIILTFILYNLFLGLIYYLFNSDDVLAALQNLTTPILYNLLMNIQNRFIILCLIDFLALFLLCGYLCTPYLLMLKNGYVKEEIREFLEVRKRILKLEVPLRRIKADIDGHYPLMWLEKKENLYMLEIESNHWFHRSQLENNFSLFASVFNMQYWKIEEEIGRFFMYFSNEEIVMTYKEFIEKYCNYSNEYIDDYINIGYNDDGVVKVKFEDIPHIFIGGTTGSGKSNLTHVIIDQLKRIGAKIKVIDGKGSELDSYKNEFEVVTDTVDFLPFIERQYKTMKNRHNMMKEKNVRSYCDLELQPTFLIFEEISLILGMVDKNKSKKQAESEFQKAERLLTLITRGGRDAGIFLILTTQDPQANNISSKIRGLLNFRILLCPVTEILNFDMLFGSKYRKLPQLKRGYGYYRSGTEPTLFQVPLFPLKAKSEKRPKKKIMS